MSAPAAPSAAEPSKPVEAEQPTAQDVTEPHPRDAASKAARRAVYLAQAPARLARRYPVTIFLVIAVLGAALASGAGWRSVHEADYYNDIAYGTPALSDGKLWTFLTGEFFVAALIWLYLPILALLAGFGAVYERRAGHVRLFVVVVGGQALASLLTAAFFLPFRDSGWTWAHNLAEVRDVGISSGVFALVGAMSTLMQPVWRTRVRVGLSFFLVAMVLNSGFVWDVGHLVGWVIGLVAGPLLLGKLPTVPRINFWRRSQRAIVALVIAVLALSDLIDAVFPGTGGPFYSSNVAYESTGLTIGIVLSALVLFAVADGLRRGHRIAWAFVTVITVLNVIALVSSEPSAERTADLVLDGTRLVLLLVTFRAFTVRSPRRSVRRVGRRLAKVLIGLFAYTAIGFALLKDDFSPPATPVDMLGEFVTRIFFSTTHAIEPVTTAARWFVGSIGAVWLVTLIITLIGLVYSARRVLPEPEQDHRMRELLRQHESSSIGFMLTWKGSDSWFSASGTTAVGYRIVGTVALALGDPVGPIEERFEALEEFDRFCFVHGWIPCFFAAGQATANMAPKLRWKAIQVAEDDVVPLKDLAFKGKSWQDVRTALNKAGKQDITLQVLHWSEARPVITDQLHAISQGWVSDKSLPEMGFTLGTLREAQDPEVRLHLAVAADGTVEGFTSWMPVSRDGEIVGWCLDLMRRRDEGEFRSVMEFLIGASAMQFKEEGFEFLSLSAAPLAKAPEQTLEQAPEQAQEVTSSDQRVLQRLLDFLGDALEPYYGFRSLLAFKAKFQPHLAPMYLVFPSEAALAEIGIAIARAYMPDATAWDWAKMSAEMVTTPAS